MAQSWRLQTKEKDVTEIAGESSPIIGATVVNAPKGPKEFFFFNKGDTQKVLDVFGYPSNDDNGDFSSIQDALDIVNKCSMWLATSYESGEFGGVFVTPKGTVPFPNGYNSLDDIMDDLEDVEKEEVIGQGDDATLVFKTNIISYKGIKIEEDGTIKVKVGETDVTLTKESTSNTYVSSSTFSSGSVTFNGDNGNFTLTYNTNNAPSSDTEIKITYTLALGDTYFILADKFEQADDLRIRVVKAESVPDNVTSAFDIYVERYNPISDEYTEFPSSPFTVGLKSKDKDSYGNNIYIKNVFGDSQFLFNPIIVTDEIDNSSFKDDKEFVALNGGSRTNFDVSGGELGDFASVYDKLKDTNKYQLKFVFDCGLNGVKNESGSISFPIVSEFETLRDDYQKRCRFLYCTPDVSGAEIVTPSGDYSGKSPSIYAGGVTNNRGLWCYCLNWGIHTDIYQGNDFVCSNMGLIAGKLVDVLEYGGGTPAWIDDNGVGGLLGSSITKLNQTDISETLLEQLDTLGFNPVVNDYTFGPMIVGWRTRQIKKTVYSYIGQSSLADTIIDEIEKTVMPYRVAKLIDSNAYTQVTSGCNTILNNYSEFLEDYFVWCDEKNNPAETRLQQKLNLSVGIVFKGYANEVLLSFVTYKNGVDVKEALTKS